MAERIELNQFTVEHVIIDLKDRLGNLETLDGTAPKFDIRKHHGETYEFVDQVATSIGMTVFCLVNTISMEVDEYELFLHFNNLPEIPRLGPYRFLVNA